MGEERKFLEAAILGVAVGAVTDVMFDALAFRTRDLAVKQGHQAIAIFFADHDPDTLSLRLVPMSIAY